MGEMKRYKQDAACDFDTTVESFLVLDDITVAEGRTSHNDLVNTNERSRCA